MAARTTDLSDRSPNRAVGRPPETGPTVCSSPPSPAVRSPGPVRSFLDDDAGYLAWTAGHADGFVVNADRTLSPHSLVLHRASCPCIGGLPSPGRTRTANYRKVCAADLEVLLDWSRTDIGIEPGSCRRCLPLATA